MNFYFLFCTLGILSFPLYLPPFSVWEKYFIFMYFPNIKWTIDILVEYAIWHHLTNSFSVLFIFYKLTSLAYNSLFWTSKLHPAKSCFHFQLKKKLLAFTFGRCVGNFSSTYYGLPLCIVKPQKVYENHGRTIWEEVISMEQLLWILER